MKKIINFTFAIFLLTCLSSCEKSGMKIERTENPNFEVSFLFEHEGIKVYRFHDGCRYHYFTSKGEAISTHSRLVGKTVHYWDENI